MTLKNIHLPQHVAIIMDGNRRWARGKNLPVLMGHREVVEKRIEELIERAAELHIPYITFWAFSTENWEREGSEVGGIMELFRWALKRKANTLIKRGARLNMIGDIAAFPEDIEKGFSEMMEKSKDNTKVTVTFALNYGGRDELLRAINLLLREMTNDKLQMTNVNEKLLEKNLDTVGMPDPDLIIRTSGEKRLSGFMPWQSVYSELYFCDECMPDFGAEGLNKALEEYGKRRRRFGRG